MQIKSVLNGAALNLRSLKGRLEVQRSATHDPSDRADMEEWIVDTQRQIEALEAIATAYGPIIQSAISTGLMGKTHKISVHERAESKLTGEEIFVLVSEHVFSVE
jgi:hypothetical protein